MAVWVPAGLTGQQILQGDGSGGVVRGLVLPAVAAAGGPVVLGSPQGALEKAGSEMLAAEPGDWPSRNV